MKVLEGRKVSKNRPENPLRTQFPKKVLGTPFALLQYLVPIDFSQLSFQSPSTNVKCTWHQSSPHLNYFAQQMLAERMFLHDLSGDIDKSQSTSERCIC